MPPAPEVLHQGVPHVLMSVVRGCIQTKALLKCSGSLVHQCGYAVWNCSASLLFVLAFNSFPGIDVFLKGLCVELPFKYLVRSGACFVASGSEKR